jgi:GNAT superfamily N-acetyltransferase
MSGRVRPAMRADLALLPAIENSGAETFARYGEPLADGSPPAPPGHYEQVFANGLIWVSENGDGQVVGFLAAQRVESALHVEEVDVLIEHQGRGHGRRLMTQAIDWARGQSLEAVTLTTFRHIPWNGPFYASMGFAELSAPGLPERLADILAEEASRGFENRCAMRLSL